MITTPPAAYRVDNEGKQAPNEEMVSWYWLTTFKFTTRFCLVFPEIWQMYWSASFFCGNRICRLQSSEFSRWTALNLSSEVYVNLPTVKTCRSVFLIQETYIRSLGERERERVSQLISLGMRKGMSSEPLFSLVIVIPFESMPTGDEWMAESELTSHPSFTFRSPSLRISVWSRLARHRRRGLLEESEKASHSLDSDDKQYPNGTGDHYGLLPSQERSLHLPPAIEMMNFHRFHRVLG